MLARVVALLLGFVTIAGAESFSKWRTPEGSLHFGDRPPAGSVLLETIEFEERVAAATVTPDADPLVRAAADGREIMRRRASEREAERQRRAEAAAEEQRRIETEDREEPRLVVVTSIVRPPCHRDPQCPPPPFGKPPPVTRPPAVQFPPPGYSQRQPPGPSRGASFL